MGTNAVEQHSLSHVGFLNRKFHPWARQLVTLARAFFLSSAQAPVSPARGYFQIIISRLEQILLCLILALVLCLQPINSHAVTAATVAVAAVESVAPLTVANYILLGFGSNTPPPGSDPAALCNKACMNFYPNQPSFCNGSPGLGSFSTFGAGTIITPLSGGVQTVVGQCVMMSGYYWVVSSTSTSTCPIPASGALYTFNPATGMCERPAISPPNCPYPSVSNGVSCVCNPPNFLSGGVCTPPINCTPPWVSNGVSCVCNPPNFLSGGVCTQPINCTPPWISNGVSCVCNPPDVFSGGACIYITCPPPSVLNPSVGGCVCNAPNVIDSSGLCTAPPETFRISLTLASGSIEPSGTATGDGNSTKAIFATVISNKTNQPQSGAKVRLTVDVGATDGGHDHGETFNGIFSKRPQGSFLNTVPCVTAQQKLCATNNTGYNGVAGFTFFAPIVSGTHTITATCDSCTNSATKSFDVKVPNLLPIPASQFYTFVGATSKHSGNHYLTKDAASILWRMAVAYHFESQFKLMRVMPPLLRLNDASLVWGGKFDVAGNWAGEHAEHKRGTVIDIRAREALNKSRFQAPATFVCREALIF